ISLGSYKLPAPDTNAPPCRNTITGSRLRDDTLPGTKTLRDRQSSFKLAVPNGDATCGHALPNAVASIVPDTALGGVGAANRRLPTGAAAKRIPLNEVMPLALAPLNVAAGNVPLGVLTVWANAPPTEPTVIAAAVTAGKIQRGRPASRSLFICVLLRDK